MGKNLKILGLSLLALTAVMAVSASAAQAKWLLLESGASVNTLSLNVTVNEGEFLVPGLGIKIHCAGGTGTATASTNAPTNTVLSGSASGTFTGCADLEFSEVCDVHSLGQPNGSITASGSGTATMGAGGQVYLNASSASFSTIVYLGEECPLHEVSLAGDSVAGSIKLEVLSPLTDATSHTVDLVGQSLTYGGQAAELMEPLSGTIKQIKGNTFSVHLVGL